MRELPQVCRHLHLPVQSGSTGSQIDAPPLHRDEYLSLVDRVRTVLRTSRCRPT
jgi:tRNA A37 methylthiotransferase MiaB